MPPAVVNKDSVKKGGRKTFTRTHVPVTERRISLGIVVLLGLIGLAIIVKGRFYDPGLYSLRTEALNSTRQNIEGKSATARSNDVASGAGELPGGGEVSSVPESGSESHDTPAVSKVTSKGVEIELAVPGLKAQGKTEFYNPDNLFEKIDGRAPSYLGFNFQQLSSRSFSVIGSADSYVDVYEYRMDTPVNAFGIFALERDAKAKAIDFAPDGYAAEMGFFFRQGAFYVQIIASDQKPKTLELALATAKSLAKTLKPDNTGIEGARHLPVTGQIPGTLSFVQENALGQSFFKNVFVASYQYDSTKLPFFVMLCPPAEATAAWQSYLGFSSRFGKASQLPETAGARVFEALSFGKWRVVYQRGGEVGGVYDAVDNVKARDFVLKYLRGEQK